MINIKKRPYKKRVMFIILATFLILAIGAGLYIYYFRNHQEAQIEQNTPRNTGYISTESPTNEQTKEGDRIKKESVSNPDSSTVQNSNLTGDITSTNQANDTLYIRTSIDIVSNDGSCTLTMVGPSEKQYVETVGIQAMPSSSVCKGFNVPLEHLSKGDWSISIVYTHGSSQLKMSRQVVVQ